MGKRIGREMLGVERADAEPERKIRLAVEGETLLTGLSVQHLGDQLRGKGLRCGLVLGIHVAVHVDQGEAVVIGNSDNLEVWEPGRWRANLASVQSGIASDLKDLGV